MKLEDLQVYDLAMQLGERIWKIAEGWSYFERVTIGKQLIRGLKTKTQNYLTEWRTTDDNHR